MLKWNALTTNQKIAVMAILVPALITMLGFLVTLSNGTTQTTNGGDTIVHKGTGDIIDHKSNVTNVNQNTSGDGSPAINSTNGDVIINITSPNVE